jgi:ADP-ribose pyrophosphatase
MTIKVNSRVMLHQGKVFALFRENVTLPDDIRVDLELIRHPGAAAIIAIDGAERMVLIRQYRHALEDYIWEIPAGTLNRGEIPDACARRELAEEAGIEAERWQKIGEITPVPGYADERIHVFLASGLREIEMSHDIDEVISVHRIPVQQVIKMVYDGQIQDAKTLSALLLSVKSSLSVRSAMGKGF